MFTHGQPQPNTPGCPEPTHSKSEPFRGGVEIPASVYEAVVDIHQSREKAMKTLAAGIATTAAHHCMDVDLAEVRLSNCVAGCKVMACRICGAEYVAHSSVYGCQRAREDYFQFVEGPSLAALHRRWLDRGLPAETWPKFAQGAAL